MYLCIQDDHCCLLWVVDWEGEEMPIWEVLLNEGLDAKHGAYCPTPCDGRCGRFAMYRATILLYKQLTGYKMGKGDRRCLPACIYGWAEVINYFKITLFFNCIFQEQHGPQGRVTLSRYVEFLLRVTCNKILFSSNHIAGNEPCLEVFPLVNQPISKARLHAPLLLTKD